MRDAVLGALLVAVAWVVYRSMGKKKAAMTPSEPIQLSDSARALASSDQQAVTNIDPRPRVRVDDTGAIPATLAERTAVGEIGDAAMVYEVTGGGVGGTDSA